MTEEQPPYEIGPFSKVAMPMIRKAFPSDPVKDLLGVPPMGTPVPTFLKKIADELLKPDSRIPDGLTDQEKGQPCV